MLLVDASVPTQNVDLGCAEWMFNNQVPFSLVFTKADKRKKKVPLPAQNIAEFEEQLGLIMGDLPPTLVTSSSTQTGKQELLVYLAQLRELYKRGQAGSA